MTTNSVETFAPLKGSRFATVVERLYKFYFQNRTGPYILYGVTFLVVFTYAALRVMVWRGTQWRVALECAVLAALCLVGLPLVRGTVRRPALHRAKSLRSGFNFGSLLPDFAIKFREALERLKHTLW